MIGAAVGCVASRAAESLRSPLRAVPIATVGKISPSSLLCLWVVVLSVERLQELGVVVWDSVSTEVEVGDSVATVFEVEVGSSVVGWCRWVVWLVVVPAWES